MGDLPVLVNHNQFSVKGKEPLSMPLDLSIVSLKTEIGMRPFTDWTRGRAY